MSVYLRESCSIREKGLVSTPLGPFRAIQILLSLSAPKNIGLVQACFGKNVVFRVSDIIKTLQY